MLSQEPMAPQALAYHLLTATSALTSVIPGHSRLMHSVCSHEREAVPGRVLSRPCEATLTTTGWRVTEGSRGGTAGTCSCDTAARVCTIRVGPLRHPEIHYDGFGYDASAASASAAAGDATAGADHSTGSGSSSGWLRCAGQTKLVPLSVSTTGALLRQLLQLAQSAAHCSAQHNAAFARSCTAHCSLNFACACVQHDRFAMLVLLHCLYKRAYCSLTIDTLKQSHHHT